MSQEASLPPLAKGTRGSTHQVRPCEIFGGQSNSGTGVSPNSSVLHCHYHSTNPLKPTGYVMHQQFNIQKFYMALVLR